MLRGWGRQAHREDRIGASVLPLPRDDKRLKQTGRQCVKEGWKNTAASGPTVRPPYAGTLIAEGSNHADIRPAAADPPSLPA